MGILDEISAMKNQGMDEKQILSALQEKGVTPKSIEEAFNQIKIKKAVSAESASDDGSGTGGMEPSIMKGKLDQPAAPLYSPKTQEIEHESRDIFTSRHERNQQAPSPQQQYAEYNQQEEYYPQEGGYEAGQMQGQSQESYDTDTLIEIAEQVFLEKIKKEQKQISSLNEFASLAETKISNHHERIKRIEEIMDKLQAAILEKVGSYGKNLDSIKNEMEMMQESFGKMVPALHERNSEKVHKSSTKKKASKKKEED